MKTITVTVDDTRGFVPGMRVELNPPGRQLVVVGRLGDTLKLRPLTWRERWGGRARTLYLRVRWRLRRP